MSPITTHVLDTARGRPAEGVEVSLEYSADGSWKGLAKGITDKDGRVGGLLPPGPLDRGLYRLTFDTGPYFKAAKVPAFFPRVEIVFEVSEDRHHHVPLLLSPFGYSTYRGS